MRISDWSSDVCSSDLLNVAVGHFRKEISSARADGADSLQRVHALGPTDFDLMIAALFDQLKVVHRHFGKIGRASCRERVCQYVSFSVVAGSLNKHLYHTPVFNSTQ